METNRLAVLDHRVQGPECSHAAIRLDQIRPASGLDGSA
ncbi:MAG: hypothetical protein QOH04_2314 [Sphingomonadales bacterium]|jgi:hypothetical protein|nr:hypothetical protein [Sphingomonadales bacterium]